LESLFAPIVFLFAGFAALVWSLLIQSHLHRGASPNARKRLMVPLIIAAFCVATAMLLLILNHPS
jgi:hypothetical protein